MVMSAAAGMLWSQKSRMTTDTVTSMGTPIANWYQ